MRFRMAVGIAVIWDQERPTPGRTLMPPAARPAAWTASRSIPGPPAGTPPPP